MIPDDLQNPVYTAYALNNPMPEPVTPDILKARRLVINAGHNLAHATAWHKDGDAPAYDLCLSHVIRDLTAALAEVQRLQVEEANTTPIVETLDTIPLDRAHLESIGLRCPECGSSDECASECHHFG